MRKDANDGMFFVIDRNSMLGECRFLRGLEPGPGPVSRFDLQDASRIYREMTGTDLDIQATGEILLRRGWDDE